MAQSRTKYEYTKSQVENRNAPNGKRTANNLTVEEEVIE